MLRFLIIALLSLHGLIHLMGFAKAFHFGSIQQLSRDVSKPAGIAWLITALLFITAAALLSLKKQEWWMLAIPAIVISQVLIIYWWENAKVGTFANILLLIAAIAGSGKWQFQQKYYRDARDRIAQQQGADSTVITEKDLQHLPAPVKRYLYYTKAVGKPRIYNMRVTMNGRMREKGKDWFPFKCVQYNFYDKAPARLFYMEGKMFGMWVPGYHAYRNGIATMDIRAVGLYPIINAKGPEMNKAETVTLFNDMCFLAPATLVDDRIQWRTIDDKSAKAMFTCKGITISAILVFNTKGELVDFISDDRYNVSDMQQYRFSTPAKDYRDFNGYKAAGFATAVWYYPEGPFTYGEFRIKEITYNVHHLIK